MSRLVFDFSLQKKQQLSKKCFAKCFYASFKTVWDKEKNIVNSKF